MAWHSWGWRRHVQTSEKIATTLLEAQQKHVELHFGNNLEAYSPLWRNSQKSHHTKTPFFGCMSGDVAGRWWIHPTSWMRWPMAWVLRSANQNSKQIRVVRKKPNICYKWITGHWLGWFKTLHMKPSISSASGWNDILFTWKAAPMGKHGWIFRVWQPYIAATGHKWYQVIVTVTPHKIAFFSKSLMTVKPTVEPSKHQPPSLWSSSLNSDLKVAASSRSVASGYAWSANEIWSVLSRKW